MNPDGICACIFLVLNNYQITTTIILLPSIQQKAFLNYQAAKSPFGEARRLSFICCGAKLFGQSVRKGIVSCIIVYMCPLYHHILITYSFQQVPDSFHSIDNIFSIAQAGFTLDNTYSLVVTSKRDTTPLSMKNAKLCQQTVYVLP